MKAKKRKKPHTLVTASKALTKTIVRLFERGAIVSGTDLTITIDGTNYPLMLEGYDAGGNPVTLPVAPPPLKPPKGKERT